MNNEITRHHQTFESLKHLFPEGDEYWFARELQTALNYASWAKFERVINKAITACKNTGHAPGDHFTQVGKMVPTGSGAVRKTRNYRLGMST